MTASRGRIVAWEGGSLWIFESDGNDRAEAQAHVHHAIQVTFQLHGSFELAVADAVLGASVVAVDSDVEHAFQGSGAAAFLFIAPESGAGRTLRQRWFAERPWVDLAGEALAPFAADLNQCRSAGWSHSQIRELGRRLVATLAPDEPAAGLDSRVAAMIDYVRENLDCRVLLPVAAAHVHLSEGRARHLFAEATRMPFKAFVLWLRLERAIAAYAAGSNLTAAAHDAGFADSAHLSRTFRRTFGLPAAKLKLIKGGPLSRR